MNTVEVFDVITLKDEFGKEKTFKVLPNKYESDKQYLNLKIYQMFVDDRGHKWKLINIAKNDKYAGISSVLPKMSKVTDRVVGKWMGGPSRYVLADIQEYRMNYC